MILGYVLVVLALPPLIYIGNPAVALLVGGVITLGLNRAPLAFGASAGTYLLQTAIVLLGLRLNLETLWQLSADYSWGVAIYVLSTLAVGLAIGWCLKVEVPASKLITAGTAICGATAIATLGPIVKAQPQQIGVALATVFLLNVIALFAFPLIGEALDMTQREFGLWSALAIHDTSSVVATAAVYGEEAADVATTIKLGRTLWLIPLVFAASLMERSAGARIRVPGFIVLFIATAGVASLVSLPALITNTASLLSKAFLVGALFLVGTQLTRETVRNIKGRSLGQALILWAVIVPLTLAAIMLIYGDSV